jgi:hypothetical protein
MNPATPVSSQVSRSCTQAIAAPQPSAAARPMIRHHGRGGEPPAPAIARHPPASSTRPAVHIWIWKCPSVIWVPQASARPASQDPWPVVA